MANLIDTTYFWGELEIAGLDTENNPIAAGKVTELTAYITKYQPIILKELLSATVYDEFIGGLSVEPIADKWKALRDKLVSTGSKTSPLANFVYWMFIKGHVSYASTSGEVIPTFENAVLATVNQKIVRAWNEAYNYWVEIVEWLIENESTYECQANGADFPQFLEDYGTINTIGI